MNKQRLLSIDTLRGFDMMFIMGFAGLVTAICGLFPGGADSFIAQQMRHVDWNGFAHHDTIFPLFLFISGMTFPFSAAKRCTEDGRPALLRRVFSRGLILVLLGLVYNHVLDLDLANVRIPSVLARIGLAWMFAALIYMYCSRLGRIIIAVAILVAYNLLLMIPAPDAAGASALSLEGNIVGYVDRMIMPSHLLKQGVFDPEGILSTFPAIVTAMLGQFTGDFVRKPDVSHKTLKMLCAAAVMLGLGLLWNNSFPINKKLWTSSFVLVAGAYSVAMFAVFYWIIDVNGWTGWTPFFQIIGLNSITIYFAQRIIPFSSVNRFFFGGLAGLCPEPVAKVILAVGYVAICWLFLWFLHKKKVYLKV